MNIKWIGKLQGEKLPSASLPSTCSALPEVKSKSALLLIPILAFFFLIVYMKYYMTGLSITLRYVNIGFLLAIVTLPLHELIHAIAYPWNSEIVMYYTMAGLGTSCTRPVSKKRFIAIDILPMFILGVIPLFILIFIPKENTILNSILFGFSFIHLGGGYSDVQNIINILKVPSGSTIQISGSRIYWY